ncbi:ABC transporter permease subunit [Mesorhizobium sp. M1216]
MMRMTRAAILNVMQSAYIETAELKNLALNIVRKHAFPNAIAPIINVVMLALARKLAVVLHRMMRSGEQFLRARRTATLA